MKGTENETPEEVTLINAGMLEDDHRVDRPIKLNPEGIYILYIYSGSKSS